MNSPLSKPNKRKPKADTKPDNYTYSDEEKKVLNKAGDDLDDDKTAAPKKEKVVGVFCSVPESLVELIDKQRQGTGLSRPACMVQIVFKSLAKQEM